MTSIFQLTGGERSDGSLANGIGDIVSLGSAFHDGEMDCFSSSKLDMMANYQFEFSSASKKTESLNT
jgi:hypothetical protein